MTKPSSATKPDAGNPHVRFDEGEVASCTAAIETEGRNSPSIAQGLPKLRRGHCRRRPEAMTRPQVASRSEVARGLRASVCAATPRRGSLLYKVKTMLALSAAAVSSALSAAVPAIRYTAEAPFDAEGKRIESVWKNADTCVRFVEIVPSSTAASLPSPCHTYSANGILSESRHSLIFVRGGRGGDEGLARTRGGYLRKT